MTHSNKPKQKPVKYPAIRSFVQYVRGFRGAFLTVVATFTLSNLVLAAVPWLIGQLVASLTANDNDAITMWTIGLIIASVGHDALWRLSEILYLKLLYTKAQRYDDIVFSTVMQHDYSYFVDRFSGKISSYANSLGREFRELLDKFCFNYVSMFVTLPVIAVTMFTVNAQTGAIFVVSLILMFIVGRKLGILAAKAERREADARSSMDGHVVDTIANFVSVKAFGNERQEATRIYRNRQSVITTANHSFKVAIYFWGAMSLFVRWIIWPSTILLNVNMYMNGQIDLAQMTTFLAAIVLFSNFIWDVIWNVSQLTIQLARTEEAYQYLFDKTDIVSQADKRNQQPAADKPAFQQAISLNNLSFAYPDKPETVILHDINFTIKQGEKIGIVGPSGGGKTTLFKLLLGYYPVDETMLSLDGKPTDNRSLTPLLAYVPQDTTIFHRSIRENIAYARADASQEAIVAAAKHAQADGFISQLEHGYDTMVGERGVKLSGGQRQRIAIARAVLKDAPLLLLDEATSALDSQSEKLIQAALWDLMEDRTAIVVAHRLSTIQKMDRIMVMDKGKLVEQGSHEELLSQGGLYATLWSHQSDGFIVES